MFHWRTVGLRNDFSSNPMLLRAPFGVLPDAMGATKDRLVEQGLVQP